MRGNKRPVIGIPADRRMIGPHPFHAVGEKYIAAVVQAADCLPLLIPVLETPLDVAQILAHVDGIFFPGSPSNVEPTRYAGNPSVPGTLHDPHRDATTLSLIPRAVEQRSPGARRLPRIPGNERRDGRHAASARPRGRGLDDHREDKEQPLDVQYAPVARRAARGRRRAAQARGRRSRPREFAALAGRRPARAGPGRRGARARRAGRGVSRAGEPEFRARGAVAPRVEGDDQSVFAGAVRRVRPRGDARK